MSQMFHIDAKPPSGLSSQDMTFLKALYSGSGALTVKQQRAVIRRLVDQGHLTSNAIDANE